MIVFTWGTPLVALGFILFLVHFLAAGPLLFNIDREIVFSKNSWLQFAQLMFSLCGGMPFLSLYHILAKTRLSEYENKGAAELKELKEQKQGIFGFYIIHFHGDNKCERDKQYERKNDKYGVCKREFLQ